ncbi:HAD family hydrolase [Scytonema millei]|uniref:HAD-IA family hydrolase n=1 Tax=Scytonema millei VB511283 TaxID=1245923 RepID=A0A9X5E1Y0_9CYAN|nr:HAD-IA family hydrolase [Scytonema millei]NHC33860.1 HAD-IA family hydrolase [Scytonema millei VB511283]
MLAAILYDLDGTIVNTDPLHFRVWQALLQEHGIEIDEEFYKNRMSGRLNPFIVQELFPEFSSEEVIKFSDRKEAEFRELAAELKPIPGLLEVIAWADERGIKQAVVTNAPSENAKHMLSVLNLEHRFERVFVSQEIGMAKPDPGPYLYALAYFGFNAQQALVFEDSPSGIRAAVGAGIPTVGITSSQTADELDDLGAMLAIPDFTDSQLWGLLGSR